MCDRKPGQIEKLVVQREQIRDSLLIEVERTIYSGFKCNWKSTVTISEHCETENNKEKDIYVTKIIMFVIEKSKLRLSMTKLKVK